MFFLLEDDCPAERLCPVDWTLSTTCRFHRVVCLFVCCFWLFVERRLLEGFVHHLLISPAAGARPHCCQFLGQQPHSWAGHQAEPTSRILSGSQAF